MTMTMTQTQRSAETEALVRPGRWCVAAGIVGALQGMTVLAWPHEVAATRFSFPFTATWHVIAQATFFAQHLPLVVAVGALARLSLVRQNPLARRALVVATIGLIGLALMEIVAMSAATTGEDSTLGSTVSALYGLPVLLIGGGLTVGGVSLLRRHLLPRTVAWMVASLGVFVFVGLTPALATDSFVGGRVAIAAWNLMFAGLGWAMQATHQHRQSAAAPKSATASQH